MKTDTVPPRERFNQRNANRIALEMAAAMVRDADFEQLFASWGDDQYGREDHDEILTKAQDNAVRRIMTLVTP